MGLMTHIENFIVNGLNKILVEIYNKYQQKYYAYINNDNIIRIGEIDYFSQTPAIFTKSIKQISSGKLLDKIKELL